MFFIHSFHSLAAGFTVFCMIAAYFHYTIDCIFGFLISYTIWKVYHRYAVDPVFLEKHPFIARFEALTEGRSCARVWRWTPILYVRNQIPWDPPKWLINLDDSSTASHALLDANINTAENDEVPIVV